MPVQTVSFSITWKLLLAFLLVPLVELTLLVQLYQRTDFVTTVLVVIFTGILGVHLTRRQGLDVWRAIHRQLAEGTDPSAEIVSGVMILLAGAFLMTPGLLTDGVGFLLLIPWVRRHLRRRLAAWFRQRTIRRFGGAWSADPFSADTSVPPDGGPRPSVRVVRPSQKTARSAGTPHET